jgi:hypothetical protein
MPTAIPSVAPISAVKRGFLCYQRVSLSADVAETAHSATEGTAVRTTTFHHPAREIRRV